MKRLLLSLTIVMGAMTSCALDKENQQSADIAVGDSIIQDSMASTPSATALPQPAKPKTEGKSRIVNATFHSQILGADRTYTVYLPKSYDVEPDRQYPILYLLHGMLDDNYCWTTRGHLKEVMDTLVAQGKACEMVIVTPCAGGEANKDWNGYFNMRGWHYEDFFFKEFMPFIEREYRIQADRSHRAAAGLSMGGGAATSFCQRYPDLFCACYAMSALMDIVPLPGHKAGPNSKVGIMSAKVGELSCSKFLRQADAATIAKMKTIRWYVDCGDRDFLLKKNQEFMAAMDRAGIPYKKQIRKGTHSWQYWHSGLFICLPFITESFGK